MAFLVISTIFLILKGSLGLNNFGKEKEVDTALNAMQKRVPCGVKKKMRFRSLKYFLTVVLLLMISFKAHFMAAYRIKRSNYREREWLWNPCMILYVIGESDCESFPNWKSAFFSISLRRLGLHEQNSSR